MKSIYVMTLVLFNVAFASVFSEIYIIGEDGNSLPCYWSISPPDSPSSFNELDIGSSPEGYARALAFSPNETLYIGGNRVDDEQASSAAYWTISNTGNVSTFNTITGTSDSNQTSIHGIAFNPAGVGYMVGMDELGHPCYWTISSLGVISGPSLLGENGYASAVGFTPSGIGYIAGLDDSYSVCYWSISAQGVVTGTYALVGGEVGGAASAYAVASTPSGITYIVGNTTATVSCYWTISAGGVASSAIELDGGSNSNARGVAFFSDGSGMVVGQASSNVSCYWLISSGGTVGSFQALQNGSGNGSSAYGVTYSLTGEAYIVGADVNNQAALWTLAPSSNTAEHQVLESGGYGIALGIANYFPQNPSPPQNLSARYVKNNFGWIYEYCVLLQWSPSNSNNVVSYNIYKDNVKIGSVRSPKTIFENHDQKKTIALYGVTAVDDASRESTEITFTIN